MKTDEKHLTSGGFAQDPACHQTPVIDRLVLRIQHGPPHPTAGSATA